MTKLTANQHKVLEALRDTARHNFYLYKEKTPFLFEKDCAKVLAGDEFCTLGMGGLTWGVGHKVGMSAGAVLSIFKALERKGLVLRETHNPRYKRPLYWWPVGMAAILASELDQ